jgi:PrcB C-terminal
MRRELWMLGVLGVAGCASATDRDAASQRTDSITSPAQGLQPLRQLLQEHSSGVNDSTRRVITDSTMFAQLWRSAYSRRGHQPAVPAIDFSREMVIVASMGTRNTGGYTIAVDSVRISGAELQVFVASRIPGPTCGTTAALTQPVVMVAVPRASLTARYVERVIPTDCG